MIRLLSGIVWCILLLIARPVGAQQVLSFSLVEQKIVPAGSLEENSTTIHIHAQTKKPLEGEYKFVVSAHTYRLAGFNAGILTGPYQLVKYDKIIEEGAYDEGEQDGEWLYYREPWQKNDPSYLIRKESYRRGVRHGEWVEYRFDGRTGSTDDPLPSEIVVYDQASIVSQKTFYADGALKSTTAYQNNVKHGPHCEYYADGNPQSEVLYADGQLSGETVIWHPNGQVLQRGQYDEHGKATGRWESWSENGTAAGFAHFEAGVQVGPFENYDSNGTLMEKGAYSAGGNSVFIGDYVRYYPNGKPAERCHYDENGHKQGPFVSWHENGRKKHEGQYKNDAVIGKETRYHDDGRPHQITHYSDTEQVVDDFGKQRREFVKDGVFTRYDRDGNLEEEGVYKQHKKHGVWKVYYNGQLRKMETYRDGYKDGPSETYHEGRIREKGNYITHVDEYGKTRELKDGIWVEYYYEQNYTPGTVKQEIPWKAGERNGTAKRYTSDGRLSIEEIYENGKFIRNTVHR